MLLNNEMFIPKQKGLEIIFGKSAASFLQQLDYWIQKKNIGKVVDGKKWIFNTLEQWADQINISVTQIKRITKKLKEDNIINVKKLSKNKSNRTNFYTINYENLHKKIEIKNLPQENNNCQSTKSPNFINPLDQNGPMVNTKKNINHINHHNKKNKKIFNHENFQCGKMIKIWNDLLKSDLGQTSLNKKLARYLNAAFKEKFNSCIEKWTIFCESIRDSQFLTGKKVSFKATIDWVLKFDVINKILNGHYESYFKEKFNKFLEKKSQPNQEKIEEEIVKNTKDCKEIIEFKKNILQIFGTGIFVSWFQKHQYYFEKNTFIIQISSPFVMEYIENSYLRRLQCQIPHSIILKKDINSTSNA